MRVLITGGAGFIGSFFTQMILTGPNKDVYEKVTVVDALTYAGNLSNLSDIKSHEKFTFIEGNICSKDLMYELIANHDTVINFAAESHVDRSLVDASHFIATNYFGVFNILSALKKYKGKKLIQISTDEVYGQIESGSWVETQVLDPRSPYSATKAAADLLALAYANSYGLDICITRASNNFGLRQNPEKLIPNTIVKAIKGEKIPVYGKGENIRDWLYVGDHALGIEKVIFKGKSGNIYNLGGDNELSNITLVKYILDILKLDHNLIEFVKDRDGHDYRYSLLSTKAKQELGYMPSSNFASKIEETVEWYIKNESWWSPLVLKNYV